MTPPKKVHVAGAGLVGSLLSVMLGKRGYDVTLIERRADMRSSHVDSGRSINLALSSRGIFALEQAGLMDDVSKLLIPMRGRMLHFEDGRTEFMPYGQRPDELIYSVSRRDLNQLLMNQAERAELVNIRFEQSLESIDLEHKKLEIRDHGDGNSSVETFDVLVGADGAGSRTRRAMMDVVQGDSVSEFLDHDYKELEIPAGEGSSPEKPVFQIEPHALHIWPRNDYMLIALPNQDGSFTVTLFMPRQGQNSFASLDLPGQLKPFFEEHFPDALKLIPDLEADYQNHPQGRLGTLRCHPWFYRDAVVLVGDAAHAIVPFHGQGMNAGFEDCSELIRLLDEHGDDWSAALPEYDRIRRPNGNAIADMALENYVTMRDSVTDPKFSLKKAVGFELEKRFPERFIPRYSMVMFHLVPYATALSRGAIQQQILEQLTENVSSIDQIDFGLAEKLVEQRL